MLSASSGGDSGPPCGLGEPAEASVLLAWAEQEGQMGRRARAGCLGGRL